MRQTLATYERTRTIKLWHYHSEILGHDYMLVAVKVVYDPAVFKSESDVDQRTAHSIPDLQAYIDEPELHIATSNEPVFNRRPNSTHK